MVRVAISQAAFDAIARTLDPLRRATTVAGLDKAGRNKTQYPDQGAPCLHACATATKNRVDCKAVAHDRTKDIDCSVEADPDDAWT
jgi:hypothetical protein